MNNTKKAEQAALVYMQTTDVALLPQALKAAAASDYEAGYADALESSNAEQQTAFRTIVQALNYLEERGQYSFGIEKAIELLRYGVERLK